MTLRQDPLPTGDSGSDMLTRRLGEVGLGGAEAVVLMKASGSVTAQVGSGVPDPLTFGSLAPAHLEAGRRLASLLGGVDLSALVLQGTAKTTLLRQAGSQWLIAGVYPGGRVPREVMTSSEEDVAALEGFLESFEQDDPEVKPDLDGWTEEAESEIDRIFGGED